MEGNSACCSTKLIISPSSTSSSLAPNEMLKNNTQECKPSDAGDNDDKVKDQEGHSENIGRVGVEETGREKLKRLREEVMMEKISIPEDWGQEQKLKDWIDYTVFDAFLAPHSLIVSARDALCMQSKVTKIK